MTPLLQSVPEPRRFALVRESSQPLRCFAHLSFKATRMNEYLSRRTFLVLAAAGVARAQESNTQQAAAAPSSDAQFSTDVKVVTVLATVHDKQGKIVSNLTKDDFDLTDEGRPQTIRYFSRETDLPLTLGLLVDTSLSQRLVLNEERDASRRFVEKVLREDRDQTFLIHFDHDTELLQDLTSSRAKLERALDQVEIAQEDRPQMSRRGGGYPAVVDTLAAGIRVAAVIRVAEAADTLVAAEGEPARRFTTRFILHPTN